MHIQDMFETPSQKPLQNAQFFENLKVKKHPGLIYV